MSGQWPPPPDLESIQELVRDADVEGLIEGGAPGDEYEPEGEAVFAALAGMVTAELTGARILPVLEEIWRESFGAEAVGRLARLVGLAGQIERFFGPEAVPQVR